MWRRPLPKHHRHVPAPLLMQAGLQPDNEMEVYDEEEVETLQGAAAAAGGQAVEAGEKNANFIKMLQS